MTCLYADFDINVTVVLQQAALLNNFFLTELVFDRCSHDLTLNNNFYILNSFLLYLLFMLLIQINYIHTTCLYADLDIFYEKTVFKKIDILIERRINKIRFNRISIEILCNKYLF